MRRRTFLSLIAGGLLLTGLQGSASPTPPTGFLGAYSWRMDDPRFGGFSGFEISDDGSSFVALSDTAVFVKGQILRDATGKIISVTAGAPVKLKVIKIKRNYNVNTDSEGLAQAADGSFYVSFEGRSRVVHYPDLAGEGEELPIPSDFVAMAKNGSLEALAIAPDGTLFTLAEGDTSTPDRKLYRFKDGQWNADLSIQTRGEFLPVGADFGPDGRLYLLERAFYGLAGFASRLRRFDVTPTGISNEVTLLQTPKGLFDNFEGVAIWRNPAGKLVASMVSDDNFMFFLRTQIAEFELPD
jgi:hypothetical protein